MPLSDPSPIMMSATSSEVEIRNLAVAASADIGYNILQTFVGRYLYDFL